MTYHLGISAHYHDAAAALSRDGEIIAAASEERFSRVKHDPSLPVRAVKFCLKQAGITMEDVAEVVYYEKPTRKFERILVSQLSSFPKSRASFTRAMRNWLTERLWLPVTLPKALGVAPERLRWCDHHLSHAASAFYPSPFEEAAVLVVDGVGEWATTSLFRAGPAGLVRLSEVRFPHSIGLVYSAFTAFLGFAVNDGEYKVMGMAPFGQPKYVEEVRKILRLTPDGGFSVDLDYVSYHWSATDSFTAAFEKLFGPPRFPGAAFDPNRPEGRHYADIAASIQAVTEEALAALCVELHRQTGLENLCFAGGVALNSVANTRLLGKTPFKNIWVQPAAGDAGGAIGAALWAWAISGGKRGPGMRRPDLGMAADPGETQALLNDLGVPFEAVGDVSQRAAEDLAAGKVLGWVQGRFEWGPRALGHRSILADPTRREMLGHVNDKIKFRELFRPFAPSVQAGAEGRYFQVPAGGEHLVRWMLGVCPTTEAAAGWATTHVDGSARVHVVEEETHPRFYGLLGQVGQATGHPVLLNTSFNLKGEPIVNTPLEALATFRRSGLDVLYIDNLRIPQLREVS